MTSLHFHHAYLLQVHHQSAWSTADPGFRRLHLLPEEEQRHSPNLNLEMYNPPTKCKCQIYLTLTDNSLTLGTQPHNHSADGSAPARQEVLTSLKRKAADQPLSATQNLISETLADTKSEVNHLHLHFPSSTTGRLTEEFVSSPSLRPGT